MLVLMVAFTLFHLLAGTASLGLAVRLLTPDERAQWRAKGARIVAEVMCWVYPALAFVLSSVAWRAFNSGSHYAFPLMLAPFAWLIVMGVVFAIVDFVEDGVLGNARTRE